MPIGLQKCRKITILKAKVVSRHLFGQIIGLNITEIEPTEVYNYLGVMQSDSIDTMQMRKHLLVEFKRRLHAVCKTQLNGKDQMHAVNILYLSFRWYHIALKL